jgi:hypothetical protein
MIYKLQFLLKKLFYNYSTSLFFKKVFYGTYVASSFGGANFTKSLTCLRKYLMVFF